MGRAARSKSARRAIPSTTTTVGTPPKTDPPMVPLDGTPQWFQSEPDILSRDPAMAGLMVRIGMAVNALTVHLDLGHAAGQRKADAVRQRDNLVSLVMTASLAFEALRLARENQSKLRPLLQRAGGNDALLFHFGKLLAGKHPASALLERARNSLGFHWDYKDRFIGPIVKGFERNKKIIWVEEVPAPEANTVHRLASEVLAHALLPEASAHSDSTLQRKSTNAAIQQVIDALNILAEYFTAAVVAYLHENGVSPSSR